MAPAGYDPGVPVAKAPLELGEPHAVECNDIERVLVEPSASLFFAPTARLLAPMGGFGAG